jgi:hypothetical protein
MQERILDGFRDFGTHKCTSGWLKMHVLRPLKRARLVCNQEAQSQCFGCKHVHRSDAMGTHLIHTVFAALVINSCVQVIYQQLGVVASSYSRERGKSLRVVSDNLCVGSTHRCCNLARATIQHIDVLIEDDEPAWLHDFDYRLDKTHVRAGRRGGPNEVLALSRQPSVYFCKICSVL